MTLFPRVLRSPANLSVGTCAGSRPTSSARPPVLEVLEDRTLPSVSTIASNFNGTPIEPNSSLWFTSVGKVTGVGSAPATLHLTQGEIDFTAGGTSYQLKVPDADVTFSPTATSATTSFDTARNAWETTVPTRLGGNTFLSGFALPVPAGLPGGINPVTWKADFTADTPGLSVNWQWATAVYSQFSTSYNDLNVKPVDDNKASVYQNSDHAGSPEAFLSFVLGGARGGGGSNYTGSYSGTAGVQPEVAVPPQLGSLSGHVFNETNAFTGLAGVLITLNGVNAQNQTVTMTTRTDRNGLFTFSGLSAGTYSITETPPLFYSDDYGHNNVGTLGGTNTLANPTVISAIVLQGSSLNGMNYNFADIYQGS